MNRKTFDDLKDAYALGALPEDEAREFEAYLAEHPEAQKEVAELSNVASLLALSAEDREPSADLRRDLLRAVRSESAGSAREVSASQGPRPALAGLAGRLLFRPAVAGLAALLLVGLLAWNVVLQSEVGELRETNSELRAQVEEIPEGGRVLAMSGQGEMSGVRAEVISYEGDRAVLVAENLPSIPEDRTFQIWVLEGGEAIPGGLFDPSDGAPVATYVDGSLADAEAVAVTVEPDGGSEQPTSSPQLSTEL
ncbi:Anti-sigma-K factor rskA [Rubrobacter radiotolerans]|uniref:Regulator of SigK n=1 Tax=Rubrobacter radiotolerans TaxID=42256 RepID=A0A023X4F9_RUBRA|nr:anti-sigma factor [Rubrobacter radiotolerans]AHY46895.1 Anti-sigma-K factor rskA [Rubrobacter radiotolerans]MDX5894300.1 anti-sigma factor [Rubrobacter radiotolerans]SMC05679.1 Anti-sigma-K factor RskA [Rubrobacter radiotolerans DSM 5868]